jgi:hypoxanthine phosphoribosyltransferase
MNNNLTILYSEEQVKLRIKELADQINLDYKGSALSIVYMLNGASIFAAELIKYLNMEIQLYPFGFSSYQPAPLSGEVKITLDVPDALQGRNVLILEGIVVSGRTPNYLMQMFALRNPLTLEMCAIGMKPEKLSIDLKVKYSGFNFGSEIVVGFGVGESSEKKLPYLAKKL